MTAKTDLIHRVATSKGDTVGRHFARYLLGLTTKKEFDQEAHKVEMHFESLVKDLETVSEATIQALYLYISR